jgi:hypothetical protein
LLQSETSETQCYIELLQSELIKVKAELSEKEAAWHAEREGLLELQHLLQPSDARPPSRKPKPADSGIEARLREQLAKKDQLLRKLRDCVKQLGVVLARQELALDQCTLGEEAPAALELFRGCRSQAH